MFSFFKLFNFFWKFIDNMQVVDKQIVESGKAPKFAETTGFLGFLSILFICITLSPILIINNQENVKEVDLYIYNNETGQTKLVSTATDIMPNATKVSKWLEVVTPKLFTFNFVNIDDVISNNMDYFEETEAERYRDSLIYGKTIDLILKDRLVSSFYLLGKPQLVQELYFEEEDKFAWYYEMKGVLQLKGTGKPTSTEYIIKALVKQDDNLTNPHGLMISELRTQ